MKILNLLSAFNMLLKRFKSLALYVLERKILVIILTYIFSQVIYFSFSWIGVLVFLCLVILSALKLKKLVLLIILVIFACCLRNYIDIYLEEKTKNYVEKNYLNQHVELIGYVYKEPIYKHEYARIVFKVSD